MKKVVKTAMIFLLMFVVIFTGMGISFDSSFNGTKSDTVLAASSAVPDGHVRIHYHRYAGDYDGWTLHLWNNDASKPAIDFEVNWQAGVPFDQRSDWGAYVDVEVIDIKNGLNFIPHLGDEKDVNADRSFPSTGEREFWIIQGEEEVFMSQPEIVTEFISIELKDLNTLVGTLTGEAAISLEEIEVTDHDGNKVVISELIPVSFGYVIKTEKDLDISKAYKVTYNNSDTSVKMPWKLTDKHFAYDGNDLGVTLHENGEATLKLWSPPATGVSVILYDKNDQNQIVKENIPMTKGDKGVWEVTLKSENTGVKDLTGYFYQYQIDVYGKTNIVLDPYAKSMAAHRNDGPNPVGKAAIVNPSKIGPELDFANIKGFEKRDDAIIYEVHVRDLTSDPSIESELNAQFGTFKALIDRLDYIQDLGVTHIQLLPIMKYYWGNEFENHIRELEFSAENNNYNWGYDPHNYFSPTGMYSENPSDPELRIKEVKELINEIHKRDMGVILDVVYNHTARVDIFENLVPGYYHFMTADGNPKESFGGGRLGTTHAMSRKVLVDSITYWVDEYKVDGFRFDMMGDHDAESIQIAYDKAKELNPNIVMIGEGWRTFAGDDGDRRKPADQDWMADTESVGVFSDEFRNELKSGFGSEGQPMFITGGARSIQTIFNNIKAQPSNIPNASPGDVVQYIEAHDNLTLHDVIAQSIKKDPDHHQEEIQKRIRLGNTMVLTSQGKAFIHAGQEYGRTKQWRAEDIPKNKVTMMEDENGEPFDYPYFIHDSYDSSDAINMFDWSKVTEEGLHKETMEFTKGLIAIRRATNAFTLGSQDLVNENVTFIDAPEIKDKDLIIGYKSVATDGTGTFYVFVNADTEERTLTLSENLTDKTVLVDSNEAGLKGVSEISGFELSETSITIAPLTSVVLSSNTLESVNEKNKVEQSEKSKDVEATETAAETVVETKQTPWLIFALFGVAVLGVAFFVYRSRFKKK